MRWAGRLGLGLLGVALCTGAGAQQPQPAPPPAEPADELALDDEDELYYDDDAGPAGVGDPLEGVNRGIFSFNDGLDIWVLGPVSSAWGWVVPDPVERSLRRFFDNLRFPVVFANDLFQGKPLAAGQDVARFLLNSTVGIAGFLDPAGAIGLPHHSEDFGQTLGVWGVPPGPYLMLPLGGPSSIRDAAGLVVDSGLRVYTWFIPIYVSAGAQSVDTLNRRALVGDEIDAQRRAAIDWYAAVRSAYRQHRENLVLDRRGHADEESDTGGYYPVFDAEEAPDESSP